jgi:hypothetical protein
MLFKLTQQSFAQGFEDGKMRGDGCCRNGREYKYITPSVDGFINGLVIAILF